MKSMKKYIIPLIALTALTGWGCEEEMVGGDWDYKDAMILVGQELIYAHTTRSNSPHNSARSICKSSPREYPDNHR